MTNEEKEKLIQRVKDNIPNRPRPLNLATADFSELEFRMAVLMLDALSCPCGGRFRQAYIQPEMIEIKGQLFCPQCGATKNDKDMQLWRSLDKEHLRRNRPLSV